MNFRKTSEGGWVISDPKNFVAFFSVILRGKNDEFSGDVLNMETDGETVSQTFAPDQETAMYNIIVPMFHDKINSELGNGKLVFNLGMKWW